MKRVLCITSSMNRGGAETFLMKVYRNLDRSNYQMDFCVNADNNAYANEIISYGGKIFKIPTKSKQPLKSFTSICNIVKENNYDYVMRVNEHSLSVIDLIAAKIGGAKKVIMRSSNSSSGSNLSTILHKTFKFLPKHIPDVMIAPSSLAAQYTFGSKNLVNDKVNILNNGVDLDIFNYSFNNRMEIRREFDLSNKFIVGHIGRFNTQKNHDFLLEIFSDILKIKENSVLFMVGEGNLLEHTREKAKEMEILGNCIFAGHRDDVFKILSAMDVLLLPSFYEGMPNVVIEAQATGLSCLISDTITSEANITGLVNYLSLSEDSSLWAEEAINLYKDERLDTKDIFLKKEYDINSVTNKFVDLIFED